MKYLIALWILCGIALVVCQGHYGHILVDFGREVYYPQRILEGAVLYRDLFNIYGPFAYQLNAVLYKLLGVNLRTLYISGALCSLLVVSGTYLLARRFLSGFLSFAAVFLVIVAGIANKSLFNFTFPYSWAMLYGLVMCLFAALFLFKYLDERNEKYLWISAFLAGGCVACKYEFIPFALVILFFIIKDRKPAAAGFSLLIPAVCFGTLFLQGLRFEDLAANALTLKSMAGSKILKYFYQTHGVYFSPQSIRLFFSNFYKFYYIMPVGFMFLPLLLFIFSVVSVRKLLQNRRVLLLIIITYSVGWKVFWSIVFLGYGLFPLAFFIVSFLALLFLYFPAKWQKIAAVYGVLLSFVLVFDLLPLPSAAVKTERGTIYTKPKSADAINELITYLQTETSPDERVVIFPEGMIVNFLAQRKGDDYYNSMIPLYVEVFGDGKFIEHFKQTRPEYIIFNNQKTSEYGFAYICKDYALSFCAFVAGNYKQVKVIDKDMRFLVYKIK